MARVRLGDVGGSREDHQSTTAPHGVHSIDWTASDIGYNSSPTPALTLVRFAARVAWHVMAACSKILE